MSSENCTNGGRQVTCCDVTDISGFVLPVNFIFGVTEVAQGNTHGATLLGFADALPQYRVDTILLNKAGLTLSTTAVDAEPHSANQPSTTSTPTTKCNDPPTTIYTGE